jgi:hypothetical protein
MSRRKVERAMKRNDCIPDPNSSGREPHVKWLCACEDAKHTANVPRHRTISPGVVRSIIERLICLPEGWLQ